MGKLGCYILYEMTCKIQSITKRTTSSHGYSMNTFTSRPRRICKEQESQCSYVVRIQSGTTIFTIVIDIESLFWIFRPVHVPCTFFAKSNNLFGGLKKLWHMQASYDVLAEEIVKILQHANKTCGFCANILMFHSV